MRRNLAASSIYSILMGISLSLSFSLCFVQAICWPAWRVKLVRLRNRYPIWDSYHIAPIGRMCCSTIYAVVPAIRSASKMSLRWVAGRDREKKNLKRDYLLIVYLAGNGHIFLWHCQHTAGAGHDEVLEGKAHSTAKAGKSTWYITIYVYVLYVCFPTLRTCWTSTRSVWSDVEPFPKSTTPACAGSPLYRHSRASHHNPAAGSTLRRAF